jgi:hypothetical protein
VYGHVYGPKINAHPGLSAIVGCVQPSAAERETGQWRNMVVGRPATWTLSHPDADVGIIATPATFIWNMSLQAPNGQNRRFAKSHWINPLIGRINVTTLKQHPIPFHIGLQPAL